MESLQQHIEHLGLALKAQFFAHPSWAYLIIILVFIIYLVGIICNKDWAVHPAGLYSGWHMIEVPRSHRLAYPQWPPYPLSYRIAFLSLPTELHTPMNLYRSHTFSAP